MRPATAVRFVTGALCLAAPRAVLAAIGGPDRDDPVTEVVARVLGGRLVLQAAADLVLGARARGVGAAVDLTHAASMVPVAIRWREHRRTALVSASVATATAALDLREP
jgi:hypothetical protein